MNDTNTDATTDEPMVEVRIRCGRGDVMPLVGLLMMGGFALDQQRDDPGGTMADLGEHLSDEIITGLTGHGSIQGYLDGARELANVDPTRGPPPERYDVQVVDEDDDDELDTARAPATKYRLAAVDDEGNWTMYAEETLPMSAVVRGVTRRLEVAPSGIRFDYGDGHVILPFQTSSARIGDYRIEQVEGGGD